VGRWRSGACFGRLLHCENRLWEMWHRLRRGFGPARVGIVDRGYGLSFSREVRTFSHPAASAAEAQEAEPKPCRLAETVGGEIQTVTVWPGQAPADLIDQLLKVPPTAAFTEVFGDVSSVLVFGPRGVEPNRLSALRAVVAALGPEDHGPGGAAR